MVLHAKENQLRKTRIKKGMSIRALSKNSGLSTATICKAENGNAFPMPMTAKKICDALGADFDDLFEIIEKGC